jgi:hypothetical protein
LTLSSKEEPVSRSTRVLTAVAAAFVMSTGVLLAQISLNVRPPTFKMQPLKGGGAVPLNGPVIRVPYDGLQRRYLAVDHEPLELDVVISASCGTRRFSGLSMQVAGADVPVSTAGFGKGDGIFSGSTTVTTNAVTTAALVSKHVPNPVSLCNADLDALVKAGNHGQAQGGWTRRFDDVLVTSFSLSCVGPTVKKGSFSEPGAIYVARTATVRHPAWVHCLPAAVFKPSDDQPQPRARATKDVEPKTEPTRVAPPPQRVAGAPALADLVVLAGEPAPAAPTRLRVHVANKGTAAAAPSKLTLYYHRSGKVVRIQANVPALKPDGAQWIIVDARSPLANASQLTLRVNDPATLEELDLTNNAFTVK